MPPGFTAMLMVGLVALAGGKLVEVDDSNWWQTCKSPVCSVAETQAEGLARLRVLSNYVKETMTLMGTVIDSLDKEMLEVGQELREIVGRRCHARGNAALIHLVSTSNSTAEAESGILEVVSDNDDNWTSGSAIRQESTSEWGREADEVGGSSSTTRATSHRPSSTSHTTSQSTSHSTSFRPSSSTAHATQTQTATSSTGSWRGISQYPSTTTSQSSSQHHGGDLQTSSSTTTTTTTTQGHHRPSSTLKRYEAEESETVYVPPAVPETDDWQGGGRGGQGGGRGGGRGGHGGGRGEGRGGGRGEGRGGGHWGGRGHGRGHGWGKSQGGGQGRGQGQGLGLGGLVSLTLGSSGCRGVPVGSLHYVPGLDDWCASNCPAGNCPATHCVC